MAADSGMTDAELLDELRAMGELLGRAPTKDEIRCHPEVTDGIYYHRFGSYNNALKAAGLPVNRPGNECARVSKREFIGHVAYVATRVGGAPSTTDFDRVCGLTHKLVLNWWDDWADMLADLGYIQRDD